VYTGQGAGARGAASPLLKLDGIHVCSNFAQHTPLAHIAKELSGLESENASDNVWSIDMRLSFEELPRDFRPLRSKSRRQARERRVRENTAEEGDAQRVSTNRNLWVAGEGDEEVGLAHIPHDCHRVLVALRRAKRGATGV
jgi:hypothetical protein